MITPLTDSLAAHNFKIQVSLGDGWYLEGIVPALTPDEACTTARQEITQHFPQWSHVLTASEISVEVLGPAL